MSASTQGTATPHSERMEYLRAMEAGVDRAEAFVAARYQMAQ